MSLMFIQPVPHEVFQPRRASRVSCHCGRLNNYTPYSVPSVYRFRRPHQRPNHQVPLFANILSNLLQERQAENEDKSSQKESTPSDKDVAKQEQFETRINVKGFHPDEISVKIKDDRYVEVQARHEEKSENGHTYREFKKFVQLPEGVDSQQVTPVLSTDGVLTVKVPKSLTLTKDAPITQDIEVEMKEETTNIRGDAKEDSEGQMNVSHEPTVSENEEAVHMVEGDASEQQKVDDSAKDEGEAVICNVQMDQVEEPDANLMGTPSSEAHTDKVVLERKQDKVVQHNSQSTEGTDTKSVDTTVCKELEGEKLQSKTVKIDIIHE